MEISRAHNNLINQFGSMQFSGEARIMLIAYVNATLCNSKGILVSPAETWNRSSTINISIKFRGWGESLVALFDNDFWLFFSRTHRGSRSAGAAGASLKSRRQSTIKINTQPLPRHLSTIRLIAFWQTLLGSLNNATLQLTQTECVCLRRNNDALSS